MFYISTQRILWKYTGLLISGLKSTTKPSTEQQAVGEVKR